MRTFIISIIISIAFIISCCDASSTIDNSLPLSSTGPSFDPIQDDMGIDMLEDAGDASTDAGAEDASDSD